MWFEFLLYGFVNLVVCISLTQVIWRIELEWCPLRGLLLSCAPVFTSCLLCMLVPHYWYLVFVHAQSAKEGPILWNGTLQHETLSSFWLTLQAKHTTSPRNTNGISHQNKRTMPPQLWKGLTESHNVFTMNVCVSYDSPCIRSKSSLLAVQKLEGMQSKHLRNFSKFSLSSLCLSYIHKLDVGQKKKLEWSCSRPF